MEVALYLTLSGHLQHPFLNHRYFLFPLCSARMNIIYFFLAARLVMGGPAKRDTVDLHDEINPNTGDPSMRNVRLDVQDRKTLPYYNYWYCRKK